MGGPGWAWPSRSRFCELLGGSIDGHQPARALAPSFEVRSARERCADIDLAEGHTEAGSRARAGGSRGDGARDRRRPRRPCDLVAPDFLAGEGYVVVLGRLGRRGRPETAPSEIGAPIIITLDILMPRVDGWSVLTSIKDDSDLENIPVVVVTMTDDQELCTALGASEYMSKPVDRQRLSQVVRRLIGHDHAGTVLVVDDDTVTRELLIRTVTRAGFEPLEAENGLAALAVLEGQIPSAILLDLVMPVMDGFEFLERIRQHEVWREIPVVVVTAKELTADERRRLVVSAERVLQKGSYDRSTLLLEIRRHLDRASGALG